MSGLDIYYFLVQEDIICNTFIYLEELVARLLHFSRKYQIVVQEWMTKLNWILIFIMMT